MTESALVVDRSRNGQRTCCKGESLFLEGAGFTPPKDNNCYQMVVVANAIPLIKVREVCFYPSATPTVQIKAYAICKITETETTVLRVENGHGVTLDGFIAEESTCDTPASHIHLGTTCASINGGDPRYVEVIGWLTEDGTKTKIKYAAKEDGKITFYDEADVEVMLDCKCCCEGCDPCDLNPPDINYTNVDTGKIYKVWSEEVVGLTDVHITDISGDIDFWAMSTPLCSCTTELTELTDVNGSTSFYAVPI